MRICWLGSTNLSSPFAFVILDVEEDTEVPIILGRQLLATPRVLIGNCDGKLILRAGNEELISKLPNTVKQPMELAVTFYSLDITNEIISDWLQEVMAINPLKEYLGKLTNDKGKVGQVTRSEHSNRQLAPPKGKKNEHQGGPLWKK